MVLLKSQLKENSNDVTNVGRICTSTLYGLGSTMFCVYVIWSELHLFGVQN